MSDTRFLPKNTYLYELQIRAMYEYEGPGYRSYWRSIYNSTKVKRALFYNLFWEKASVTKQIVIIRVNVLTIYSFETPNIKLLSQELLFLTTNK